MLTVVVLKGTTQFCQSDREGESMVEVKYDENSQNLKLPKNIRQVGQTEGKVRIYVEDYVVTFLNQLAQDSPMEEKLAILLGETLVQEDNYYIFVQGAVAVENMNIQEDHIGFTSGIWSKIYEDIKTYFGDTKVAGWFLTRPGKTLKLTDHLTKTHTENFPGEGKLLMITDPMDKEEQFYIYMKGKLKLQKGYYIYYERNETMQNYMIEYNREREKTNLLNQVVVDDKESADHEKHRSASLRGISLKNNSVKKMTGYAAALTFLLVATSAVAIIYRTNLGGVRTMFHSQQTEQVKAETQLETETEAPEESYKSSWTETETEAGAVDAMSTSVQGTTYIVEEGDTLAKISLKYYHSMAYVDEICRMNNIEDADYIYPGMTITLP